MANKLQKKLVDGVENKHSDDPILNLSAVADMLGRSPQTIARWVDNECITSVLMPNGLRKVRLSVVRKILAEMSATSTASTTVA